MSLYLHFIEYDGEMPDCETCGPSYEECTISYDGGGLWSLEGSWGCYSGDSFQGTRAELIEYLGGDFREAWSHLFAPGQIDATIQHLKEA